VTPTDVVPLAARQTVTDHRLPPDPATHLASPITRAAQLVQQCVLRAARSHLAGQGFAELLPPIIGPVTDPGGRGAKQADVDYYGHSYKLMTSGILYKQASLRAFDRIFFIAPNVRMEPLETVDTHRHLAEFHQIDVEAAGFGYHDAMDLAEGLLHAVVQAVLQECGAELATLGRDLGPLTRVGTVSGPRIRHEDAVRMLREAGHPQNPDTEIDWTAERLLSERADRPWFITNYPKGSRGFYDREDPDAPGSLRNFDLLVGEGFGEIASGGEREADYPVVVTRMRETGENPAKYAWYLTLAREGLLPSAGFGIGLERLVRYLCGLPSVWQASAYPKVPGVAAP
jgi:asparaginyl-tRNA synthetase